MATNNFPEELDNKTVLNNKKNDKNPNINPAAVGGVAAAAAAAAVGVTAFAMGGEDEIAEVEAMDEGVFEQAAAVVNPVHEEKKEAERAGKEEDKEPKDDKTEDPSKEPDPGTTPSGKGGGDDDHHHTPGNDENDDIIADVDPEKAAEEITGEVAEIDPDDVPGGAGMEFHNADVIFTEEGEAMIYAEVHEAGSDEATAAIVDVNLDGEFDAIVDAQGNISEMPISVSVADIEMQNQNYDEYIAYNEQTDINVDQDPGMDADVTFG